MAATRQGLLVESVQRLMRRGANARVQHLLQKTRPEDIAHMMSSLHARDRRNVFDLLATPDAQALVLAETDRSFAQELLEPLPLTRIVEVLRSLDTDDVADILRALPEDKAEPILEALRGLENDRVEELLGYDRETAGGIMSADYFALQRETTVGEAIRTLQELGEDLDMAFYIYVINEHGHLVGVVSLRQLVTTKPEKRLSEVMEPEVISVRTDADQEDVAMVVAKYNWLAVPVVDENNRLRGIVTVDDIIDVIKDEATEDILKLAGAGEVVAAEAPAQAHLRMRYPWLIASCISGFLAAFILEPFIGALGAFLGSFVPVVAGMAGNVGIQSSTIIVRGLATGAVDPQRSASIVRREMLVGLALGIGYGLVVGIGAGLLSFLSQESTGLTALYVGLAVGTALGAAMLIAATVGTVIPLACSRFGLDPAVATGPFVTGSLDVIGLLTYFGVAVGYARLFGLGS